MKALSIKQPWAGLIATGQKTIETRTWAREYRGPLLICSSKIPDEVAMRDLGCIGLLDKTHGWEHLYGCALAIAVLVNCRMMAGPEDEPAAKCEYQDNLFAWVLADVRQIVPFKVRGQLGLFDVPSPWDALIKPERRLYQDRGYVYSVDQTFGELPESDDPLPRPFTLSGQHIYSPFRA